VCVSEEEAKNLAEAESRIEKRATGATETSVEVKGKIVEFLWHLTKQGKSQYTIDNRKYMLETLLKFGVNLLDPEDVKDKIAKYPKWKSANSKMQAVTTYKSFARFLRINWEPPKYQQPESLPFIPLEKELDTLINASGKILGAFLQGLKDTGADPGELAAMEWIDVNPQTKTVAINHPVKGHNARILKVSDEFLARINRIPKRDDGKVFANVRYLLSNFTFQRKRIAHTYGNPRLLKITFRTFRHWKGTMEYHKTHDVYHVKKILGHKRLRSTEIYINLEQAVFTEINEEFHVKAVKTLDEACKLLEVGFEYVTDMDDYKLFRKRK
jgi:integrase